MRNNFKKFAAFAENGTKALKLMKKKAYNSSNKKTLRIWNLTEVSNILGKSVLTIKDHEKKKNLPTPKLDNITKKRCYTLKDINNMRDFFKIRPRKNNNCNPAIIAFTNFKGGVAKTTAAIHSAQYFAKSGYKVLLIDSDSQASTTTCFGYTPDEEIKESETLSNFFLGRINSFKSLIKKTYWNGLDLIPANLSDSNDIASSEFILFLVRIDKTSVIFTVDAIAVVLECI